MQLLVGDIEVVSTTENIARIQSRNGASTARNSSTNLTTTLHTTQPIQVDENDPILDKATKLEQLCSKDRDYYLLRSESVSAEEYAKLSLGSETTTDDSIGHVQQSSSPLPHCDDSISTTVSEESDCAVAVRVYDLNKRETKILRHDIIKRSRNPVGGESINTFDNLGNCCSETAITTVTSTATLNVKERSDSPLSTTIQHFDSRILENANETRKPPRSPTKLKSIHLNRNPRKLKMADVQLMNDAFGTSLDPKIIDELKQQRQNNGDIENGIESSTAAIGVHSSSDKDLATATEQLLSSERESSKVCVLENETITTTTTTTTITTTVESTAVADEASAAAVTVTTQCQELEKPQQEVSAEQTEQKPQESELEQQEQRQQDEVDEEPVQLKQETEQQLESAKPELATAKPQEEQEQPEVPVVSNADNEKNVLVNESASIDDVYADAQNEQHHNGNNEFHCVMADSDAAHVPATTKHDDNDNHVPSSDHPFDNVSDDHSHHHHVKTVFERNHEVIVQVNEHKEKSVIEEDVISALPSVKALARTFAVKNDTNTVPEKLQRPKVSTHCC